MPLGTIFSRMCGVYVIAYCGDGGHPISRLRIIKNAFDVGLILNFKNTIYLTASLVTSALISSLSSSAVVGFVVLFTVLLVSELYSVVRCRIFSFGAHSSPKRRLRHNIEYSCRTNADSERI
jgi:hypothetical protein